MYKCVSYACMRSDSPRSRAMEFKRPGVIRQQDRTQHRLFRYMRSHSEDDVLLMVMACLRSVRYDSNHCSATPHTTISWCRGWSRMSWSTVPNAAGKSRRTRITACCFLLHTIYHWWLEPKQYSCCEPDGMLTADARIADCPGGGSADGQQEPFPHYWICTDIRNGSVFLKIIAVQRRLINQRAKLSRLKLIWKHSVCQIFFFTMLLIIGTILSACCFSSQVGTGSNPHYFAGDRLISFSTSCMVAGVKLEWSGTVTLLTVSPTGTYFYGESVESSWFMLCRIVTIFWTNNSSNLSSSADR